MTAHQRVRWAIGLGVALVLASWIMLRGLPQAGLPLVRSIHLLRLPGMAAICGRAGLAAPALPQRRAS